MPLTGTLRTWHDDKGFGFIAPSHGGREVFVHVSAFPRDGSRPTVGERLVYELGRDKEGRPQAKRVYREALASSVRAVPRSTRVPAKRRVGLGPWFLLIAVAVGGGMLYRAKLKTPPSQAVMPEIQTSAVHTVPAAPRPTTPTIMAEPPAPTPSFRCDGRQYCSQMTSCTEAKYFLNNCPDTKMDGNHDGVPCEQQWCTGPFAK